MLREMQNRIVVDSDVLVGRPIIRGTRIGVEHILELMANGWSEANILKDYPNKPMTKRSRLWQQTLQDQDSPVQFYCAYTDSIRMMSPAL
jgi:uncharacterized protein (DUF433 family)